MSQGQTDYGVPKPALAGMLSASGMKHDASGVNAESSAPMRFGIWVKKDASTDKGFKLLSSVNDEPQGVTGFHHTYDRLKELDDATGGVLPKVDIAIRQIGIVWLRVEGAIKYGDRAHVRAVAGAGGTVLGVARADAVSNETIDCSNLGKFIGSDDGGTTPERFAPFFVEGLNALSVPDAESVDAEALAAEVATLIHGTPDFTIGAESTNDRPVSIQFNDINGDPMETPVTCLAWLSDTDALTLGTAADTIVATTGQVLKAHTAALLLECCPDANGVLALTITKSGTTNRYLNVSIGGHVYRSAVIGFTT